MTDHRVYVLDELELRSGAVCQGARLVYRTWGAPNASRSNAIVYPTAFAGQHPDVEWTLRIFDPARHFVVMVNLFGNGLSTAPGAPNFTIHDNVVAQHRLLTKKLGMKGIALVYGRSMGAMQAFHWGALFPEMVQRICCVVGSARATAHNRLHVQCLRAALGEGNVRALARVCAAWAMSQAFYREEVWRRLGHASMEDFVVGRWEAFLERRDPMDIRAMLWTWEHCDVAANDRYEGDLGAALGAIRAKALVMPSESDLYFPVEDSRREVALMPNAELRPIPSIWGHMAGSWPENVEDVRFVEAAVRELLGE